MLDWKVGDVAIARVSTSCGCGRHKISKGTAYRVLALELTNPLSFFGLPIGREELFLDVHGNEAHMFHHSHFRKERKATLDIFKMCDAPVDKKVLEDA